MVLGRGDDAVGSPHRTQIYEFELFKLFILLKLDQQFSIEQLEPTESQSAVYPPLLGSGRTRPAHIMIIIIIMFISCIIIIRIILLLLLLVVVVVVMLLLVARGLPGRPRDADGLQLQQLVPAYWTTI